MSPVVLKAFHRPLRVSVCGYRPLSAITHSFASRRTLAAAKLALFKERDEEAIRYGVNEPHCRRTLAQVAEYRHLPVYRLEVCQATVPALLDRADQIYRG